MSEVTAIHSDEWTDRIISATVTGLLNLRESPVEDLAAEARISVATLYRKIRGGRWKATEVKHVADAFHVPVSDLFDGQVTPGPSLPKSSASSPSNDDPDDVTREEDGGCNITWLAVA